MPQEAQSRLIAGGRPSQRAPHAPWLPPLLLGLVLWAPPAASGQIVSVERQTGAAGKRAIERYWTKERMRRAEPLEVEPPARSSSSSPPPERERGAPGYVSPAPPGGALRSHSEVQRGAVAGSRVLRRAPSYESAEVTDYATYPNTTNGKLFGRIRGLGGYECSATAVNAANGRVIFTAAHCVVEAGSFAKKLSFVPSYHDGQRPFGTFVWKEYRVPNEWVVKQNFNSDFAAITLAKLDGQRLQDMVGARGLAWHQARKQAYGAFGYPANHADAQRMWSCSSGFVRKDPRRSGSGGLPSGIGCDMGVGASGGGWIIDDGFLNSVSSFGYAAQPDVLYGPYFGELAKKLRNKAGKKHEA